MRAAKKITHKNCALCERNVPLSFHHLIPRKLHRRTHYRRHYGRTELNQGIMICRHCHRGIHKLYDEMTLGKTLNSVEALRNDVAIQKHISWVKKQKESV